MLALVGRGGGISAFEKCAVVSGHLVMLVAACKTCKRFAFRLGVLVGVMSMCLELFTKMPVSRLILYCFFFGME